MKLYLLFLFLLAACNNDPTHHDHTEPGKNLNLSTDSSITEVPTAAFTFETNVKTVNFLPGQDDKVYEAAEIIIRIISTPEFRSAVLNHTSNGEKTFVDNNGLSNVEIYNKILEGAEVLNPIVNNAMDVQLELYQDNGSNTVGYTYPNSTTIWINNKYFSVYTPAKVSGNMIHEWLHKLGFTHAQTYSESRNNSVPYAIGRIMQELAAAKNL